MLEILASVVEKPILEAIRLSTAISLEVDESTDMSMTRQLDIHIRYYYGTTNFTMNINLTLCWINENNINKTFFRYLDREGQLFCQFLDMVQLNDGKADTIAEAIREVITVKAIPTARIFGLGTDGAAVMTGKN